MIFQSFGSLSGASAGGVSLAAASATFPYVVVRPVGVWVITLLAAPHSATGTPQPLAAAWTSIIRAVAPPLRTYSFDSRIPRLPPVEKLPHARLRTMLAPGVGYSVVTFDQSHSSSSATICARPVSVPCPISDLAIRITTVSSGRMTTQAVISRSAVLSADHARAEREPEPQDEPAADRGGADHEGAAIDLRSLDSHGNSSVRPWPRRGWLRALAGRFRIGRCW